MCFYFTDTGYYFPTGKHCGDIHGRFIVKAEVTDSEGLLREVWTAGGGENLRDYLYRLWEEDEYSPNVNFEEES